MGYQIYRLLKGNAYGETFLGGLGLGCYWPLRLYIGFF